MVTQSEFARRQIIVDTDGACDDGIALLMCLADGQVDLRAVTTVAGAVPVDIATTNILAVLEQGGASHVPVYEGADRPRARELETSQQILGPRGMGDAELPTPTTAPASGDAAAALVALSKDLADETSVLVALGPLTNLAAAIEIDPEFLARFDEILIMGTATDGVGNITDTAEFNTWVDPEAAEVVFATPAEITVVGWEACRTSSLISTELHNRIVDQPTPFGTFVVETTSKLREFSASVGVDGYDLADGLAMAVVLDPTLTATTAQGAIKLDSDQRGQTHLVAQESGLTNVTVVETADAGRFAALIERLAIAAPAGESEVVGFTEMERGTAEDYALLDRLESEHAAGLADRLLDTLARLTDSLGGYQITRLEHSLQSATRARRSGADVDWVVAALLHDIGDELAPFNHSEFAASILQPYVREEVHWVIQHHGLFQSYYYAHHLGGGDRNARDRFADHHWAELCVQFCAEWDQNSFDPGYDTDDLASFEADVRAVFARTPWAPEVVAPGSAKLASP